MKKAPAIIASVLVTLVVAAAMVLIGANALLNPNSTAVSASAANPAPVDTSAVKDPASQAVVQQLQSQITQYQQQLNQAKQEINQANQQLKSEGTQLQQANAQLSQYQQLINALQQAGVIQIGSDGSVTIGRFRNRGGDDGGLFGGNNGGNNGGGLFGGGNN